MKKLTYTLLVALLLTACSSLKKSGPVESHIPFLGTIGQEDKSLFGSLFLQVGYPVISDPVALKVTETTFSKKTFKAYKEHKLSKGEKRKIIYADSAVVKPIYLCLEIADKIALQAQLNAEENKAVRNYLSKDEHKIVSKITFTASEQIQARLLNAEALFLTQNNHGILSIKLVQENTTPFLSMVDLEIFEFESSGFCWSKNKYGQLQIDAIVRETNRCPKGTEENAYKLKETKSYLKL